ncbi:hypothetical protein CVS30_15790 [Arthrobacter psychrolactophilus]|uniref:Uncharacterized protein n=1 Tax=Arthrobacter psychrolactophilus TaxID=92442 RepID=A0A2V5JDQ7_9MICC|nr:hypothetical protein CVS30_15790 [Arthrobacter psychrolactophilus]
MTSTTVSQSPKTTSSTAAHQHEWHLESAHNTSQGRVIYLKCLTGCGARRIDLVGANPTLRQELHTTTGRGK